EARVLVVKLRTALPRRRDLGQLRLHRLDRRVQRLDLLLHQFDLRRSVVDRLRVGDDRVGRGVRRIGFGLLGRGLIGRRGLRGKGRRGNGGGATGEQRRDKLQLHNPIPFPPPPYCVLGGLEPPPLSGAGAVLSIV